MDKETVKKIIDESMQIGIAPSAMCRAAIYLTLAEKADTENQRVLYTNIAKRANNDPVICKSMRNA